ncbi:Arylsulfatase [Pontiella desulfatans]|uniref:Arylsulfatase n=1 Tax=Pontiella desulfatans TaxID=2750659 RepID=A0A6C2U267_PONDE|nr:sulfatase [Pontiella desulfatans]SPS73896.1 sulfatase S1_11 [Kiritimatiellales bacterium]VGO13967.1 Arylsulfatase [Pontiella desulfatans]
MSRIHLFLILAGLLQSVHAKPPNILWIFTDDHSHNAISAYGSHLTDLAPTPNIDRIAEQGMLFRNSFVCNSICGPSRAAIMTGKHSHANGFRSNGDRFDGHQQTFPRLLQKAGYQTAVIGKWHLGTDPVGFDHWEILPGQGHYYNPDFITAKGTHREPGYVTDLITDKSLSWMKERDPERPFMLMLQHKAPHREWSPAKRHLQLFDDVTFPEPPTLFDDYKGRGTAAKTQDMTIARTMHPGDLKINDVVDFEDKTHWTSRVTKNRMDRMTETQTEDWWAAYSPKNKKMMEANLSEKDLVRWKYQRYIKDYLRCIRAVDENIGRVLDYLEESGLAENTVVMYSSDQSFYLGEHGWFDKRFMYEESLRTPLIAYWPNHGTPGAETELMVQNIDMAQTFLEIAGVPFPGDMQGRSLVPLLNGKNPADWRESIYYQYHQDVNTVHHVYPHYGIRTGRYKLIYFNTLDEWEFYDLEKDPQEMTSQYANPEYAGKVDELKQQLTELRAVYQATE